MLQDSTPLPPQCNRFRLIQIQSGLSWDQRQREPTYSADEMASGVDNQYGNGVDDDADQISPGQTGDEDKEDGAVLLQLHPVHRHQRDGVPCQIWRLKLRWFIKCLFD